MRRNIGNLLLAAALIFLISTAAFVDGRRAVAEEESSDDAGTPAEKSSGEKAPAADDGEETTSPDAVKGELTPIQQETADIDPAGPCKPEVASLCSDITAGNRSLVRCIGNQVTALKANKDGQDQKNVSRVCLEDIRTFKIALYKDITMDKEVAEVCKKDINLFCDDDFLYPEVGSVLACLRETKESGKLSGKCAERVYEAEEDAANDFKLDPQLNEVCSADATKLCSDVLPGEGRVQLCLRTHRSKLSWECQAELFRQEMENSDDIRLNVRLFRACLADKRKFCPDVIPGDARVKDCLEEHREDTEFSPSCKEEFDSMMARRATDFRLDANLQKYCKDDIQETCYPAAEEITDVASSDSKVIECLQDYRNELKDPRCRQQVHQLTKRAATDIRFDHPLFLACHDNIDQFCSDVPTGHARLFKCLQGSRDKLEVGCRDALFEEEIRFGQDIDFKFELRQACSEAITKVCGDVLKAQGDVIKCLDDHVEDTDVSGACQDAIKKDEQRSAQDFRLNYRLSDTCFSDVQRSCLHVCESVVDGPTAGEGMPCGGKVLACLAIHKAELRSQECKEEVLYFQEREARDVELDVPLMKACAGDLKGLCGEDGAEQGGLRDYAGALSCLRKHREKLSNSCIAEELRFSEMEASDVRLAPTLMNACGLELQHFCRGVSPEEGKAFRCLQLSLQEPGMSVACRAEVELQTARETEDYRMDSMLMSQCEADISKTCAGVEEGEEGHGLVLKCLVDNHKDLSASCQTEVSYAARLSLWVYRQGADLSKVCDEDAAKLCSANASSVQLSKEEKEEKIVPGVYGQCLVDHAGDAKDGLSAECAKLVAVVGQAGQHVGGKVDNARLEEALQMLAKLNAMKGTSSGFVLSGWYAIVAVAALVAAFLGAAFLAYRKMTDRTRDYTLVVKSGDV